MLSPQGVCVGINGIGGRIGGNVLRAMIEHPTLQFNVLLGNELGLDPAGPALNFVQCKAHDTSFGPWPCRMTGNGSTLTLMTDVATYSVELMTEKDPGKIPWGENGVECVLDCTGVFLTRGKEGKPGYDAYYGAGAKYVALSAPAKDDALTVVHGVHTTPLKGVPLFSGASCTSGSIAFPIRCLLNNREEWDFSAGNIVTVHAYTSGEQQLQDRSAPMKAGCRRMFAGACNIIPSTTGAAKAIPKVNGIGDDMKGIPFDGFALRVPVASGSVTLLQVVLEREPSLGEVLDYFREMANGPYAGKFAVNENPLTEATGLPLVSSAIVKRPESSILDTEYCSKLGPLYTFSLWYGNEWGYVMRLIEAVHEQCS